jgi:hypothetical protein
MGTNLKAIFAEKEKISESQSLIITGLVSEAQKMSEPKYLQAQVDLTVDVPEPVPVLMRGDCTMFSRGNISTIGGKAKSKKTFLIVLLSADFLNSDESGNVLIIDTEMAKTHTYKTARRVHRLMNWETDRNNERLTVLSLREYSPDERITFLNEAVEHLRPVLIFIDGIADMVFDVNDSREATAMVGRLMKMSSDYDCHIACVLHENKGNGQLRGHLGTTVILKSESILSVVNNGETSTVEPAFTRNTPFASFTFQINEQGLPEYCDAPVQSPKADKMIDVLSDIMKEGLLITYQDLKSGFCHFTGKSERTAERKIKEAAEMGLILKNEDGNYYLPISNKKDDEFPF